MSSEMQLNDTAVRAPRGYAELPDGWSWAPLESVCVGIFDCPHSTPVLTKDGPFVARTQDISTGIFRAVSAGHVSSETYVERIKRAEPTYGDLLYSREGTYFGVAAEVPRGVQVCLGQRMVLIRPDARKANFKFLRYWLNSPVMTGHIHGYRDGSVAERLNLPTIRALPSLVPSLTEQGRIAAALGALDDKIAVNERIATTVSDLVGALYEGAMECGEPRRLLLGDIAEVNKFVTKPEADGTLRYVDIASVGVGSYEFPERIPWADAPGRARRRAAVGDTIWSTVRPNRRSHALVLDDDPELVFSTGLAVLSPRTVGPALLYEVTRTSEFQSYLESVAEGSAYPAVQADRFKQAPASLPVPDECEKFEAEAMNLRLRAHQATVESRTLATLRDTLLPQLMSGKLRVRDAERIVEDAV